MDSHSLLNEFSKTNLSSISDRALTLLFLVHTAQVSEFSLSGSDILHLKQFVQGGSFAPLYMMMPSLLVLVSSRFPPAFLAKSFRFFCIILTATRCTCRCQLCTFKIRQPYSVSIWHPTPDPTQFLTHLYCFQMSIFRLVYVSS